MPLDVPQSVINFLGTMSGICKVIAMIIIGLCIVAIVGVSCWGCPCHLDDDDHEDQEEEIELLTTVTTAAGSMDDLHRIENGAGPSRQEILEVLESIV